MKLRGLLLLILLVTMVPLTPMAYASPPDPVWVVGFFDDADFDDVVVFITSAGARLELFPLDNLQPLLVPVTSVEHGLKGTSSLAATIGGTPDHRTWRILGLIS
jgi:hypothetical protein